LRVRLRALAVDGMQMIISVVALCVVLRLVPAGEVLLLDLVALIIFDDGFPAHDPFTP
jgi:hypothetical protein